MLWYAPRLPRLLTARPPGESGTGSDRLHAVLAGAGRRWLALTVALALGLVIALTTYHLADPWTSRGIGG